jgi:putative peptidoglycan lipid II flippase
MAAFLLSNVTGLIREILVSRAFGTGTEIDAFNAALNVSNIVFYLMAGGALASAFLPIYTDFLTRGDRDGADELACAVASWVGLLMFAASLLAFAFAAPLVQQVVAPGFLPQEQVITVRLLRILLISPTIFGLSGLVMGILNAHQHFLLPALAPSLYWLGIILGVLFLVPHMGINGLAWGAVVGALMHLTIQLPGLRGIHPKYRLSLGLSNPAVGEVVRLMGPRLIGQASVQVNVLVNTILASGQPEGSLTALAKAWMVMTVPEVVIAQAIGIAALPTFATQASHGELGHLRSSLAETMRGMFFLSLPASLGLILLARPLVTVLFQRGDFTAHSTDLVSWALIFYSAGLVSHSMIEVLSRAFYAVHDTLTPVLTSLGSMALNVVFSLGLSSLFGHWGWMPHGGLALANSLATTLEMTALTVIISRRLGTPLDHATRGSFGRSALATLGMVLALVAWGRVTLGSSSWIAGLGGVLVGLVGFWLLALLLGSPEARSLPLLVWHWIRPAPVREAQSL